MNTYTLTYRGTTVDYSGFTISELEELKTALVREHKYELAAQVKDLIKTQQNIDNILTEIITRKSSSKNMTGKAI